MSAIQYEGNVTEQQHHAVMAPAWPGSVCSIVAGPGCGKTYTLLLRVARLLAEGVLPEQILVLSMTNMAVNNVKASLERVFPGLAATSKVDVQTFHAFAHGVVNEKSAVPVSIIEPLRWNTITSVAGIAASRSRPTVSSVRDLGSAHPQIAQSIAEAHMMSHDDVMRQCVAELENDPEILARYRAVFVDEFQDVHATLRPLVRCIMAAKSCHVTVAGDPNQSIYGFLGSSGTYHADDAMQGREVVEVPLSVCFRSSAPLVKFSDEFAADSGRTICEDADAAAGTAAVDLPVLVQRPSRLACYDYVCEEIMRLTSTGRYAFSDFLVLSRTNGEISEFQKTAAMYDMPNKKNVGASYWTSSNVAVLAELLKVWTHSKEWDFSLLTALQFVRGVGPQKVRDLWHHAATSGASVWDVLLATAAKDRSKRNAFLHKFVAETESRIQVYNDDKYKGLCNDPQYVFKDLLEFVRTTGSYKKMQQPNWNSHLKDFYNVLHTNGLSKPANVDFVPWFLRHASRQVNLVENEPGVLCSTIHAAKGLEKKGVFVLPYGDSTILEKPVRHSEYTRVFYVAVTRASELLYCLADRKVALRRGLHMRRV